MEKNKISEQLIKKLAKGGIIIFIGSIIGKIIHFGLHVLLGRVLGVGTYGLYALGFSITGVVRSVSSLGLHQGIVRFGALYKGEKDDAQVKGTLISSLVTSLLFGIFVSVLMFVFSEVIALRIFNKPDLSIVIKVFSISLPFHILMTMSSYTARAFHKMQYDAGLMNIFHPFVNIFFVGLAFLLGFKLNGALFGFLIATILSAFFGLYFIWRIFPEIVSSLQPIYQIRKLLRFSLPLLVTGIAALFLSQTDRLMLGWLSTSREVGIYNAAVVVALQIMLIVNALTASFSPMIADLYNRGRMKEIKTLFQATARWGITLSLPLALVIICCSKNILMLFGSEFSYGWPVLVILSLAQLIIVSRGLTVSMLIMTGRQDIELFNTLAMASLNIALNYWLIKLYGAFGASIATAVSISLLGIVRLLEVKLLLGMQPYTLKCLKPLLAGLIISLIWLLLIVHSDMGLIWIVYACGLTLVYGGILYLLGIEKEDLMIIGTIKSRLLG